MSVCRKHRRRGHSSCSCPRRVGSDGYGGPDVSAMSAAAFDSLSDNATSGSYESGYDGGSTPSD